VTLQVCIYAPLTQDIGIVHEGNTYTHEFCKRRYISAIGKTFVTHTQSEMDLKRKISDVPHSHVYIQEHIDARKSSLELS